MATRKLADPAIKSLEQRKVDLGKWEAVATEVISWWRANGDMASTVDRVLLARAVKGEPILATKAAALEKWAAANPAGKSPIKDRWKSPKDCDPPFEPSLKSDSVEAYWWMRALVLRASTPFHEALLVHYSGHWASALVAALLHKGCDVSLYLCRPSRAGSKRQLIRIQDTFLNAESNFSFYKAIKGARLRIYGYNGDGPGPRHALLDAEVWCRGDYMTRRGVDHSGKPDELVHGHDENCDMLFACEGVDLSTARQDILHELADRDADPVSSPMFEYRFPKIVPLANKVDLLLDKPLSAFDKK